MASIPAPAAGAQPALRVLLAEDDEVVRPILIAQLERAGFFVHAVCDGVEVLDALAETSRYDLVLLDCQMPRMDGYSAARLIREREQGLGRARLPIIAVTAHTSRDERAKVIAAGMDDYVTKPLRMPELLAAIATQRAEREGEPATGVRRIDSQAPIDRGTVDKLRSLRSPKRPDFFAHLVEAYLTQATARCEEIATALVREDLATVAETAHGWKGGSRSIGALRLGDACERLEAAARAGDLEATRKWFVRVSTLFPAVEAALRGAG